MTKPLAVPKEPGRELDAFIAEHIFGWTEVSHGPGCSCCVDTWQEWSGLPPLHSGDDGTRYRLHPRCSQCGGDRDRSAEKVVCKTLPRTTVSEYSTDISQAWKIVAFVLKDIFDLTHHSDAKIWSASFQDVHAYGSTAPHAICMAALRKKGIHP